MLEPFSEFPWVAPSDKMATAAAILSVIGRAAIYGCVPMFSSQAPTPGSGKGLLVEVVSTIATGRMPPLMSPTDDDEEVRKRLMAIAIESPSMVVIDNVEGSIGSAPLAMALTAGVVTDRKFGDTTKMITASLRPVWVMTGNNVQLKGDLARRVVPIDLDAKCEHPEDRKFKREGGLIDYVQANRPRFVVAALTVLRAFVVAKRPAPDWPPKGSFEQWSELVRGAICYADGTDPLGGVKRIREQADEDLDNCARCSPRGTTSTRVPRRRCPKRSRMQATAATCTTRSRRSAARGRPEAKPIGHALRKVRGRIANGHMFERGVDDRNGVAKWKVVSIESPADDAGNAGNAGNCTPPTESAGGIP